MMAPKLTFFLSPPVTLLIIWSPRNGLCAKCGPQRIRSFIRAALNRIMAPLFCAILRHSPKGIRSSTFTFSWNGNRCSSSSSPAFRVCSFPCWCCSAFICHPIRARKSLSVSFVGVVPTDHFLVAGITSLLSTTVFLMLVSEHLPPTADALPLIGFVTFSSFFP